MRANIISKFATKNYCINYVISSHIPRTLLMDNVKLAACSCSLRLMHSITSTSNRQQTKQVPLNRTDRSQIDYTKRWCSVNTGPPSNKLPPLMNIPQVVWPSVFKSLHNFILSTFIIKPYFDREFSLADFVLGAKKALEVCIYLISKGRAIALRYCWAYVCTKFNCIFKEGT